MRFATAALAALLLPILSSLAQVTPVSLAAELTPPNGDGISEDSLTSILGETLALPPFDLTILTNETHALVSFNLTKAPAAIGYVAVGFGTIMADSAMVALLPTNATARSWLLSHLSTTGHNTPESSNIGSAGADTPPFERLSNLTQISRGSTIVTFIRPLALPANQSLFTHTKYLNLSQAASQKIIYAYGSASAGSEAQTLHQHDSGMFGATTISLQTPYLTVVNGTFVRSSGAIAEPWTKFDTVVYAHAGLAMVTWLLLSPLAVLVARLGRKWQRWSTIHSFVQTFLVLPLTIAVVALGAIATQWGTITGWDFHKVFGFVFFVLVVLQLAGGHVAHRKPVEEKATRPLLRVAHILCGVAILLASWIQIYAGLVEYGNVSKTIKTIFGAFAGIFLVIYLTSLGLLSIARHREGRSWKDALTGLGRESANPPKRAWVAALGQGAWGQNGFDRISVVLKDDYSASLSAWR